MNRTLLRAKIHRIQVTESELEYEGSLTVDRELLQAANMVPYERIDVWNVDNGNRFSTYLIEGPSGSGVCCVNGAAAHQVQVGDKLIIATYCTVPDENVNSHRPTIVLVSEENRIKLVKDDEAAGVRVE